MKKLTAGLASLFLLSVSLIGYELAVMRTFSVGSWSNFGSMVISIALLGFGLAGVVITFIQKAIKKAPERWLSTLAFLFMISMSVAYVVAQRIPFKPLLINVDATQFLWIGAYYVVYSIPFFIGAVFINVSFMTYGSHIHKLYFWNMTGSGVGGLLILLCMYIFPPDRLILPLIIVSFVATLATLYQVQTAQLGATADAGKGRTGRFPLGRLAAGAAGLLVSGGLLLVAGDINVSEYKGISYVRNFPEYKLDYYSYGPTGEMHLYASSYLHFAPGLSDNAAFNVDQFPVNAFKGLYIDGSGPIGVMRQLEPAERRYMDYLPMTAAYLLEPDPEVLLMRMGGGTSAFVALHHGARRINIVEPNPSIIHLIGEDSGTVAFNGGLLRNPIINVVEGEPRAYAHATDERYDIVEISLIDSVGLSQSEPYPIGENYTYTVEAITDYMQSLKPNGILSITTWDRLRIPRNVPKLLTTILTSLERQGVENPERRVFVFNLYLSTATVLVKNSDFTDAEIETLRRFTRRMSFNDAYYPGIERQAVDFDQIMLQFRDQFGIDSLPEDLEYLTVYPRDVYHHVVHYMLDGRADELYRDYVFDIRPATDHRPYYTAYLKTSQIGHFLDDLGEVSEEWGFVLVLGTLLQSIIFGLIIILIPVIGLRKTMFQRQKGVGRVILYYACLGLGYMMIEIFLIQRLVYFLGDPIFSVSIVIITMLIISGLGSLFSRRFQQNPVRRVRMAVAFVVLAVLFYIFLLTPLINALIGLPTVLKIILSVLFIAPAAFFMGMPFPSGLSALEENRPYFLPWAFGMNGALSVTGSNITTLISISSGFTVLLVAAGAIYVVAALVFPANTIPGPQKAAAT